VSKPFTPARLQETLSRQLVDVKCADPRLSPDVDEPLVLPRKVMRSPCWCGSGKELRRCHRALPLASC